MDAALLSWAFVLLLRESIELCLSSRQSFARLFVGHPPDRATAARLLRNPGFGTSVVLGAMLTVRWSRITMAG